MAALLLLGAAAEAFAGTGFTQQGSKLVGTGASFPAYQGNGVAASSDGRTILVGGPNDGAVDANGSAWVFTSTNGTSWTQQAMFSPSDEIIGSTTSSQFGTSVAISADGNTALIGGVTDGVGAIKGAAWVYVRSGTTWTEQTKIVPGNFVGSIIQFGNSVALSADGNTAVIGAPNDNASGSVWVYTRSGTTWSQQQKLAATGGVPNAAGQLLFGVGVAISGDGSTIAVGASDDGYANGGVTESGAMYIFTVSGATWTQQARLIGTPSAYSQSYQGRSVALSFNGNTAFSGAPIDGPVISSTGEVWVFVRSGTTWSQQAELVANNAIDGTTFGANQGASISVSSDGNTVVIGAPNDAPSANAVAIGAAWTWTRSGTTWTQGAKMIGTGTVNPARQGTSVAISADSSTVVIGGPHDNGAANNQAGATWIFTQPVAVVPTITSINTTSGPTAGGTSVTITGTNLSGATGVKFGTNSATGLTNNTSTAITVTSPAGTGTVDITVTTVGGTSATSAADQFTYVAPPTITSISSTTANGSYNATTVIPITVTFSAPVTVTGTPTLALNSGGSASFASGSGTATLTFNYTVGSTDNATNLDCSSTTALALAGGTINATTGGTAATLTLPTPGGANSLGTNKAIVIDTTPPTIVSINRLTPTGQTTASNTVTFRVTYSEAVTVPGTSNFAVVAVNGSTIVGTVTGVTGTGTTRDVTVSITSGTGEFRLRAVN